jgi:hypothetical protein
VEVIRRFARREVLAPVLAAILFVAALYELAVALKWIPLGSVPGAGPSGEGFFLSTAALGMLIGVGCYFRAGLREHHFVWAEPLIPVAAVGLVTARFYSFDPYYLPSLQRYSENEFIQSAWFYFLIGCAVSVACLIVIWTRVGLRLLSTFLLVCFGTLFLEGAGH